MSERVWVLTTWAHVHAGATVRPPGLIDVAWRADSVAGQQRTHPVPHRIVKVSITPLPDGMASTYDLDPAADVEILIDVPTAGALAVLAAAGLAPHVISEHESENPS